MNSTLPNPDEFGIPLFLRRGYIPREKEKGVETAAAKTTPVISPHVPVLDHEPNDIESEIGILMFLRRKKSTKADANGGSEQLRQSNGENG